MLDSHQHGAAPLPSNPDALCESHSDQQDWRQDADGAVSGEKPDDESRHAHNQQRGDEHRFASEPVAEMTEDEASERARDETDGEGAKGGKRACESIDIREEQSVENEGCRRSI